MCSPRSARSQSHCTGNGFFYKVRPRCLRWPAARQAFVLQRKQVPLCRTMPSTRLPGIQDAPHRQKPPSLPLQPSTGKIIESQHGCTAGAAPRCQSPHERAASVAAGRHGAQLPPSRAAPARLARAALQQRMAPTCTHSPSCLVPTQAVCSLHVKLVHGKLRWRAKQPGCRLQAAHANHGPQHPSKRQAEQACCVKVLLCRRGRRTATARTWVGRAAAAARAPPALAPARCAPARLLHRRAAPCLHNACRRLHSTNMCKSKSIMCTLQCTCFRHHVPIAVRGGTGDINLISLDRLP